MGHVPVWDFSTHDNQFTVKITLPPFSVPQVAEEHVQKGRIPQVEPFSMVHVQVCFFTSCSRIHGQTNSTILQSPTSGWSTFREMVGFILQATSSIYFLEHGMLIWILQTKVVSIRNRGCARCKSYFKFEFSQRLTLNFTILKQSSERLYFKLYINPIYTKKNVQVIA